MIGIYIVRNVIKNTFQKKNKTNMNKVKLYLLNQKLQEYLLKNPRVVLQDLLHIQKVTFLQENIN